VVDQRLDASERFVGDEEVVEELARGAGGRVALGSVVSGLRTVAPAAVRAFGRRFPEVGLVLEEHQPGEVLRRLRDGRLTLGSWC